MWHTYISKIPNASGRLEWSPEEHTTWSHLISRQRILLEWRAVIEYLDGIEKLWLTDTHIPDIIELDQRLRELTDWQISLVPAIISDREFFSLLSQRVFPCTSFIRTPSELDYIEEPDIFHEIFGHLPLLTWQPFADFLEWFGKRFCETTDEEMQKDLVRIFWYTVEFWLIRRKGNIEIYGAGILSSHSESRRIFEEGSITIERFDRETCSKKSYNIDAVQGTYFFIESFEELFSLSTPSPEPVSP